MSASVVQTRYEELEQIAARFTAAAEEQQALQERVNRQVEVLRSGGWQGRGVAAFLGEMDGEVGPVAQKLCAALRHAAQTTQQIVHVLRAADADASSPFRGSEGVQGSENQGGQSPGIVGNVQEQPPDVQPIPNLPPSPSGGGAANGSESPGTTSGDRINSSSTTREKIDSAIDALDVERTTRYQPGYNGPGKTYCNIYVKDIAKQLGIPLPEYLDWNKDGKADDYLDANEMIKWMNGSLPRQSQSEPLGPDVGWRQVSQEEAVRLAQNGHFVVAGWQNPVSSKPGHMAVVRGDSDVDNVQIAQAGGRNFSKGSLTTGFGEDKASQVIYFMHSQT